MNRNFTFRPMTPLTRHILYFSGLILSTLALAALLAKGAPTLSVFYLVPIGLGWAMTYIGIDPFRIVRDRFFPSAAAKLAPTSAPSSLPSSFGDHTTL